MANINQAMQDLFRYNAAILPQVRSGFNRSHSLTTTLDSAFLVPVMWDRVVPGDEKKIRFSGLARMTTPKFPVMDQANLDVWAFYIPDRLWWTHAKEFYGENLDASFNPDGEYVMPYLKPSQYLVDPSARGNISSSKNHQREFGGLGSLNDYFHFPIGFVGDVMPDIDDDPDFLASAGLHRSYQLIWNEWFRNSSVQPALRLNTGDIVTADEWDVISKIRKVNKYPDFFTSLLREPQAGDDVALPLGDWAPVVTRNVSTSEAGEDETSLKFKYLDNSGITSGWLGINPALGSLYAYDAIDGISPNNNNPESAPVTVSNLWADLTQVSSATINNLRAAITVQQLLEIDAIAGKRYQNILQGHFGVLTPDATLQRPELLGMCRTPVGMRQVLQTSSTDVTSPQGNTAAFSLTNVSNEWIVNKAFTEPGFIMVLCAVRVAQSYSQGLDPLITKINRYDHYYPVFDHLGNQPVPTSAVFFEFDASNKGDFSADRYKATLGYQSAWTEYRTMPNRVTGLMRPNLYGDVGPVSLGSAWTYAEDFQEPPVLNSDFIEENPLLIERTLAVLDEPQFLLDCYFEYMDYRPMSVQSVPGLLRL